MKTRSTVLLIGILAALPACGGKETARAPAPPRPAQPTPASGTTQSAAGAAGNGSIEVLLCDGKTRTTVPRGTAGSTIAGALMAE